MRRSRSLATVAALALLGALGACADDGDALQLRAVDTRPPLLTPETPAPLAAVGPWLVDDQGRVVHLRGVNEVAKQDPYLPSALGFDADDARFLADQGFNVVRLGVDLRGLMPAPGEVDDAYLDGLEATVEELAEAEVLVLLDFHQDGFAPKYNGNGFPDWMAIDDGLPNPPDAVFPLYYAQNPAMQRAWESFWADRPGPDGVGVQTHFLAAVTATAARFASAPNVVGYEAINEPWPGSDWAECYSAEGCPDLEEERLVPFARRLVRAVREASANQLVWVEPFVTFNEGRTSTTLPGVDDALLAVHAYATSAEGEAGVVDNAVAARTRDDSPVLLTEFGATDDRATLDRLVDRFDGAGLGWIFWSYHENLMDPAQPATVERSLAPDALRALVRPYPRAVAGTPDGFGFDPATRRFHLRYLTAAPEGVDLAPESETEIVVPDLHLPDGYVVTVEGARVTSEACAPVLTLAAEPGAEQVTVEVAPPPAGQDPCG